MFTVFDSELLYSDRYSVIRPRIYTALYNHQKRENRFSFDGINSCNYIGHYIYRHLFEALLRTHSARH